MASAEYRPRRHIAYRDWWVTSPRNRKSPLLNAVKDIVYDEQRHQARKMGSPVIETHLLPTMDLARESYERDHPINLAASWIARKFGREKPVVLAHMPAFVQAAAVSHDLKENVQGATEEERQAEQDRIVGRLKGLARFKKERGELVYPLVAALSMQSSGSFYGATKTEKDANRDVHYATQQLPFGKGLPPEVMKYWPQIQPWIPHPKGADSYHNMDPVTTPKEKRPNRIIKSELYHDLLQVTRLLRSLHGRQLEALKRSRKEAEVGRYWPDFYRDEGPFKYRVKSEISFPVAGKNVRVLDGPTSTVYLLPGVEENEENLDYYLPENWRFRKPYKREQNEHGELIFRGNQPAEIVFPGKRDALGVVAKPVEGENVAQRALDEVAALILAKKGLAGDKHRYDGKPMQVEQPLGIVIDYSLDKPVAFVLTKAVKAKDYYGTMPPHVFNDGLARLLGRIGMRQTQAMGAGTNLLAGKKALTLVGFHGVEPVNRQAFIERAGAHLPYREMLESLSHNLEHRPHAIHIEAGEQASPRGRRLPNYAKRPYGVATD